MKKNKLILFKILFICFALFTIIYYTKGNEFFEYAMYKKTKLTEKNIKEFEKDIKNGKNISNYDYVKNENVDYSTPLSTFGSEIGENIETFMNEGIKKTLKLLSDLFYE